MKRVLLFIVTNLAVMLVLGIAANVLGLNRFLAGSGLNVGSLLGFAALMGFGGAGPLHGGARHPGEAVAHARAAHHFDVEGCRSDRGGD